MDVIIRGTTPTISITFSTINVDSISVAYLVIKSAGETVIEKNIESAEKTENSLDWTLSQQESFLLMAGTTVKIYCDWRLADGTRGRSKEATYKVDDTGKNEVI